MGHKLLSQMLMNLWESQRRCARVPQAFYGKVLTELDVSNPHVTLQQVVDLLNGLVFQLTGLLDDKQSEMRRRASLKLKRPGICTLTHDILQRGRSFGAQPQRLFPAHHFALAGLWCSRPLTYHI